MNDVTNLETLIRQNAASESVHTEIFNRVAPEAANAHEAAVYRLVKERESRQRHFEEHQTFSSLRELEVDPPPNPFNERLKQRLDSQTPLTDIPIIRADSRVAWSITLQPVRDLVVEGILVLSEDRKLDIFGPPYPNFWTSKSGNAFPALQTVWANPGDGAIGFGHEVVGTVTGRQANSGAGVYVQFVPKITPGIAQIRPFAPYSYQWVNVSFKSREDNLATFGIRVWSWDLAGADFAVEQDYTYSLWNNTSIASYFATSNSPSWLDNQDDFVPGWDADYGFLFPNGAPYFKTRPNRVYMAAIWCFGTCWSVSRQNRPGLSIGRLHAKVPWVVIGYQ